MAVKGKSKAEILAAFRRLLANDANAETTAALSEIDRIARAAAQGHPVLEREGADDSRGRILSFNEDPAVGGPSAYSLIADGAILVAGGRIEAVGLGQLRSPPRAKRHGR